MATTTVAELERGMVAKERSDPARGDVLRRWFEERVLPAFAGRVLPFGLRAARILATCRIPEQAPFDGALIAAIAWAAPVATEGRTHGVAESSPG